VTAGADEPLGRVDALERLRAGLGTVSDMAERLDAAEGDRERRSVLLAMVTAALEVRDRAADAYAALERGADEDGIGRGVVQ
jgi:hypothetical protein